VTPGALRCDAVQERLLEALTSPAPGAARIPVEVAAHARACPACQEATEQFSAVTSLLRGGPVSMPPPGTWDDLGARIERAVDARRRPARTRRLMVGAAAAALVIGLAASEVRLRIPVAAVEPRSAAFVSADVREMMPHVSATLVDYHAGMRDGVAFDRVFDVGAGR
jgi:hypothetical protein